MIDKPFRYSEESNALEAMYVGAIDGLKICGYILANILAIISVLEFVNSVLEWLGNLVNIDNLSFQVNTALYRDGQTILTGLFRLNRSKTDL